MSQLVSPSWATTKEKVQSAIHLANAGAVVGGYIGSALGPVGTVVGAAAGAATGGIAGAMAASGFFGAGKTAFFWRQTH